MMSAPGPVAKELNWGRALLLVALLALFIGASAPLLLAALTAIVANQQRTRSRLVPTLVAAASAIALVAVPLLSLPAETAAGLTLAFSAASVLVAALVIQRMTAPRGQRPLSFSLVLASSAVLWGMDRQSAACRQVLGQ